MKKRINFIGFFIIGSFFIVLFRLFNLIVLQGNYYIKKLEVMTDNTILEDTPRGRIYDRNGKLLVDNKSIPVIYFKNINNYSKKELINYIYKLVEIIDIDYSKIDDYMIKEFLICRDNLDDLILDNEWELLDKRKISIDDIYNLKVSRINLDSYSFSIIDYEVIYVFSLLDNGYSYQDKIIKDKNISDKEIAYISENINDLGGFNVKYSWEREYLYGDVLRSILGNVSYISKEDKNYYLSLGYSLDDLVGISFLEKEYEYLLKGEKEKYEVIDDELVLVEEGSRGKDIVLTIDIELQMEVEKVISEELINAKYYKSSKYYNHAYVVVQEPNTGEILAISGKEIVKKGSDYEVYDYTPYLLTDSFAVGSVVKGASILVGYQEEAIKIGEYMYDDCIKIYGVPKKCSWSKLGRINDLESLAYSSNIYQFKTAMKVSGFNYQYNKKFDVSKDVFSLYRNMYNSFGLGVKTGIDLPIEGVGMMGKEYSSDLLLNLTIGQYDTYTALQLSQYITTIASDGKRIKPHLLKGYYEGDKFIETEIKVLNNVEVNSKYLKRVQQGFYDVMDYGLGTNYMGKIKNTAAKTGTSEMFYNNNPTLTNTFVGYAPFDNPKMTITVVSPNIVSLNDYKTSRSYANRRISRRITEKFFEMY